MHDLRHTVVTLATGGSLPEVMHWLGHTTTVAAVRHHHVMADPTPPSPAAELTDRARLIR